MQMAKASISENDEALFAGKRRHNNYKIWNGDNTKGAADWKGKNFRSGEQWRLKSSNERGNWPMKNFNKKKTNSDNSQYEVRKKIISEITNMENLVQEFALTSVDRGAVEALATIDYSKDWIVDPGCSHHLTGDVSLLSSQKEHKGNKAIVTADSSVHPVENEGHVKVKTMDSNAGLVTLNDVYHVHDEDVHDKSNPRSPTELHKDCASEIEKTHEANGETQGSDQMRRRLQRTRRRNERYKDYTIGDDYGPADQPHGQHRQVNHANRALMAFARFSEMHEFEKPNDEQALNLMNTCAVAVLKEFNDIVFSYGVSDEYSFVLKEDCQRYQRRASYIVSAIVSLFSSVYVMQWINIFPNKELKYTPCFDGRAVCHPSSKILQDYLAWRQVDCHINNQTKREAQIYLKGTQTNEKYHLLAQQFNIDYDRLPIMFRRGSSVFREQDENTSITNEGTKGETQNRVVIKH
ncbi:hypothetical protein POM88_050958 [Heracleum sosnowskyi]|uniref:tRNA(His) guanylyltransferase n=1 Tax=Heracleum sosnowskyi TaxID=360622 RepID=A0AAD8H107_9APIA|nr:hypothetical protein POM88_050958 [Heracleum sosnowskyi]